MSKDRNLTRPVELIVAASDGGDSGFWYLVDVDIPKERDNDADRQQAAFDSFYMTVTAFDDIVFLGVFNVPGEDEDWSCYGYDDEEGD